jgi:hypothetical protein
MPCGTPRYNGYKLVSANHLETSMRENLLKKEKAAQYA